MNIDTRATRIIYKTLIQRDLSKPIRINELCKISEYESRHVKNVLKFLHENGFIDRHRNSKGDPYYYVIK